MKGVIFVDVKSIEYPKIGKVVIPYTTTASEQKNQSFGYIKPNISMADEMLINMLENVEDSAVADLKTYITQLKNCNAAFLSWILYIESLSVNNYLEYNIKVNYSELLYEYANGGENNAEK